MSVLRPALVMLALMTVSTGAIYPVLVTATAQLLFADQASGSLIHEGGRVLGSRLIGQPFTQPGYFWSRPSATSAVPYDAAASSGSNQGPLNPALAEAVTRRIAALREVEPENTQPVPVDLVTASGSGLDPHISPRAAYHQAVRVAKARGLAVERVQELVARHTEPRTLGLLGEPRVNVLALNLALDRQR